MHSDCLSGTAASHLAVLAHFSVLQPIYIRLVVQVGILPVLNALHGVIE